MPTAAKKTAHKKTAESPEAAPAAEPQIVAYKGFDKDLKCRDFQYEVGRTYEHKGHVKACSSGFHACENPFDVWSYYGPCDDNRFARVTLSGAIARHSDDSKIAAGRITVEAELRLPDFIRHAVNWIIDATKGKGDDPSGDYAQIGSSGDYARIGSSGYYAQIGSSGDSARIGSSGYYARIEATGESAVVACAGVGATVKAGAGGAICIPYHDGKRTRFAVGYVGEDGIKAGVFYTARDGKLVEA